MKFHRDIAIETLLLRPLSLLSATVELGESLHELTVLSTKRFRHCLYPLLAVSDNSVDY